MFDELGPKIVVMEEAAEVLDPLALSVLVPSVQHLILLGDHQQLAPRVNVQAVQAKGLGPSIMERLLSVGIPSVRLNSQNRMLPELAEPLRQIYPDLGNGIGASLVTAVPDLPHALFWWDLPGTEQARYANHTEALAAVECACILVRCGLKPKEVTILTMYADQETLVRETLHGLTGLDVGSIHTCTVDSFQGNENRAVVLSTVRSNDAGRTGFLQDARRRCVALSRAQAVLVVVGNAATVRSAPGWSSLLEDLGSTSRLSPSFPFSCREHSRPLHANFSTLPNREYFKGLLSCACLCSFYP